jgi:hypothetical protein
MVDLQVRVKGKRGIAMSRIISACRDAERRVWDRWQGLWQGRESESWLSGPGCVKGERQAKARAETGGVRAYQMIIGSVASSYASVGRLCCGGSNPNKARQIQYVFSSSAGGAMQQVINQSINQLQQEDWQRIELSLKCCGSTGATSF